MIGGARDIGTSESGNYSEVGEKPRGMAKMKVVEEIVALNQGRGLYSGEEWRVVQGRNMEWREIEEVLHVLMLPVLWRP